MKISIHCIVLLILLFWVYGCKSPQDDIKDRILEMKAKTVSIPYSQMRLYIRDSVIKKPNTQAEYKLVVYMDSSHCSECEMKKMHLWDDFVKLEDKYDGRFSVVFIVQTSSNSTFDAIVSALDRYEVEYQIYVDNANVFSKQNPHIPSRKMYHVFLLDEKNNVVFVGNPLLNSDIENSLLLILEQGLK